MGVIQKDLLEVVRLRRWTLRKECNRQMRRIVGEKRVLEGGRGGKTEANIFTMYTGLGWSVSRVE